MRRKLLATRPALKVIRRRAAERRLAKIVQCLGQAAAARIKALYPIVESDGQVGCGPLSEGLGQLSEIGQKDVHRKGVMTQGNACCHDPRLNQKAQLCLDGIWGRHADSFPFSSPVQGTAGWVSLKHIEEDLLGVAWLFSTLFLILWVTGAQ